MTNEQIERLRKGLGSTAASTTQDDVTKLLDEREALLEALIGLEVWITKNVSADFNTGQSPPQRIEALAVARQALDKVSKP